VAPHFYSQCGPQGRRPLRLCSNRPLPDLVDTRYGFCDRVLRARGLPLDFRAMRGDTVEFRVP
jgi:hypothetical protein